MKGYLARYFESWWLPALVQLCLVGGFAATAAVGWRPLLVVTDVLFVLAGLAFLAVIAACIWNFTQGRLGTAVMHLLLTFCCGAASVMAVAFAAIAVAFGPSEDGFADNLTIPAGIEIAEPEQEAPEPWGAGTPGNVEGRRAQPFRLLTGMQPGIYGVAYSLNPGEPGSVHLKAFEVTQGTPLSVEELEDRSKTRMKWSTNLQERFGAKAGCKIYEGDWGKPYAARFEVWFSPESGKPSRKLAERVFKIEGWQR